MTPHPSHPSLSACSQSSPSEVELALLDGAQSRPEIPSATSQKVDKNGPKSTAKKHSTNCLATLQRYSEDSWTSEILAMSFSALCLVAMSAVLRAFDGRPVPELPDVINLNAIVSTLSAAAKSSLIYAVSAALGQAKWNWYYGPKKRLEDFEILDEASRGPLGSVRMLLGGTASSIGSLGAVVTIVALVLDPFVQQIINISSDPVMAATREAWTGRLFEPSLYFSYNVTSSGGRNNIIESINSAIWNRQSIYDRNAHCPTGNCTWDPFLSLGWCVKSLNVTGLEDVAMTSCSIGFNEADFASIYKSFTQSGEYHTSSRTCKISLDDATEPLTYPIEFSLRGGNGPAVVNPSYAEPDRVMNIPVEVLAPLHIFNGTMNKDAYLGVENPVLVFGHARFSRSDITNETMKLEVLEQSVLSLCVSKFNVNVTGGQTSTQISERRYGRFYNDKAANAVLGEGAWCWTPSSETPTMPSDVESIAGVKYLVDTSTTSFCMASDLSLGTDIADRLTSSSTLIHTLSPKYTRTEAPSLVYQRGTGISSEDILSRISSQGLQNITEALGAALNSLYYDDQKNIVPGNYVTYEATIHVRWQWMTLPILLEILGIFFTLIVVYSNRHRPLWKGSIIAALYHGLEHPPSGPHLQTASGMAETAKTTRVNIGYSEKFDKMVLR